MLNFLSVFSFDFISLKCLHNGGKAFYATVYLWCILPIVIACVIFSIGFVRIMLIQYNESTTPLNEQNKKIE